MEKVCDYFSAVKDITWRRLTLFIYLTPFVLLYLLFNITLDLAAFSPAVVVSRSKICVEIGKKVLEEDGSAVDAAIATLLCEGLASPDHAGIGGGFAATLFVRGKFDTIVAAPTMPKDVIKLFKMNSTHERGPKTIGVPGELMGYWEMHKKYGTLPWRRLFEPSIQLAEEGVPISQYFRQDLLYNSPRLSMSSSMLKTFPRMEEYTVGDKIKYHDLARTLGTVAHDGVSAFYNGDLGKDFVRDIADNGGIMKFGDLREYRATWNSNPPTTRLRGHRIITTPLPTSGPLIILVINIIKSLRDVTEFWPTTMNALKFSFGLGSQLGDADNDKDYKRSITDVFNEIVDQDFAYEIRSGLTANKTLEDSEIYGEHGVLSFESGSLNVCVLGKESDAVVVTTSLSSPFGASFVSTRTGIIPNNILARYFKAETKNRITQAGRPLPGKRVLTPHSPTIVVHKTKARPLFIVGATGGPIALTRTVSAIVRYVLFRTGTVEAVSGREEVLPSKAGLNEKPYSNKTKFQKNLGFKIHKPLMFDNMTTCSCIGFRWTVPEPQNDLKIGERSDIIFPDHGLNYVLVMTMSSMLIVVVAILLYEVHVPIHQMVINLSKSRAIL